MITIKEEKIAEMMFDIWHESDKLKNPVMVGEYIAKKLLEAINYTHCCKSDSELLKDKVKLTFKNWLFSSGIRYVSGHNYKSNDGDIYDIDELEKMYKHYLSL